MNDAQRVGRAHESDNPAADASDLPWVLVDSPGNDDQDLIGNYESFAEALQAKSEWGSGDVMRRLPSGELTTEF